MSKPIVPGSIGVLYPGDDFTELVYAYRLAQLLSIPLIIFIALKNGAWQNYQRTYGMNSVVGLVEGFQRKLLEEYQLVIKNESFIVFNGTPANLNQIAVERELWLVSNTYGRRPRPMPVIVPNGQVVPFHNEQCPRVLIPLGNNDASVATLIHGITFVQMLKREQDQDQSLRQKKKGVARKSHNKKLRKKSMQGQVILYHTTFPNPSLPEGSSPEANMDDGARGVLAFGLELARDQNVLAAARIAMEPSLVAGIITAALTENVDLIIMTRSRHVPIGDWCDRVGANSPVPLVIFPDGYTGDQS